MKFIQKISIDSFSLGNAEIRGNSGDICGVQNDDDLVTQNASNCATGCTGYCCKKG